MVPALAAHWTINSRIAKKQEKRNAQQWDEQHDEAPGHRRCGIPLDAQDPWNRRQYDDNVDRDPNGNVRDEVFQWLPPCFVLVLLILTFFVCTSRRRQAEIEEQVNGTAAEFLASNQH